MWGSGTGASIVKGWASIPENYVTNVPVLTLDRILGNALDGKKALILVDIEGAEFMMLQGAHNVLTNQPRPIWMMEISSTEHQPNGVAINPDFSKIFELFFSHGYKAFTADEALNEISLLDVERIFSGNKQFATHNYLFMHSNDTFA